MDALSRLLARVDEACDPQIVRALVAVVANLPLSQGCPVCAGSEDHADGCEFAALRQLADAQDARSRAEADDYARYR